MSQWQLLSLPTSPYSARVRIQALEKNLALEIVHPSPGQDLAAHAACNPFHRVPVLVTDSGFIIESAAIQEFLEDVFPEPSMRPATPLAAARMRAFVQAVDQYLFPPVRSLRGMEPGAKSLSDAVAALDDVLNALQKLMDRDGYICGGALTLADAALAPAIFFLEKFLAKLGEESAIARNPVLAHWWETVGRHDSVSRVMADLQRAIKEAGR